MKTVYKSRWDPEVEVHDSLGARGRLIARIAVPRSELHLVGASGVEEVDPRRFPKPGMAPVYPRRQPTAEPGRFRHAGRALLGKPIHDQPIGWRQVVQNPFRLGNAQFLGDLPARELRRRRERVSSLHLLNPSEIAYLYLSRPNGYINLGLHFVLDRIFNLNTPDTAIDSMGISNDTTAVVAGTLLIDPTPGSGSPDFQALAAGVGAAATSRSGNTVTCSSGWEPADFSTVFAITKVGLSTNAADSGDDTVPTVQGVVNIVGGTGGSAPYNEPLSIDLTTVSDFDLTLAQAHTAQAT